MKNSSDKLNKTKKKVYFEGRLAADDTFIPVVKEGVAAAPDTLEALTSRNRFIKEVVVHPAEPGAEWTTATVVFENETVTDNPEAPEARYYRGKNVNNIEKNNALPSVRSTNDYTQHTQSRHQQRLASPYYQRVKQTYQQIPTPAQLDNTTPGAATCYELPLLMHTSKNKASSMPAAYEKAPIIFAPDQVQENATRVFKERLRSLDGLNKLGGYIKHSVHTPKLSPLAALKRAFFSDEGAMDFNDTIFKQQKEARLDELTKTIIEKENALMQASLEKFQAELQKKYQPQKEQLQKEMEAARLRYEQEGAKIRNECQALLRKEKLEVAIASIAAMEGSWQEKVNAYEETKRVTESELEKIDQKSQKHLAQRQTELNDILEIRIRQKIEEMLNTERAAIEEARKKNRAENEQKFDEIYGSANSDAIMYDRSRSPVVSPPEPTGDEPAKVTIRVRVPKDVHVSKDDKRKEAEKPQSQPQPLPQPQPQPPSVELWTPLLPPLMVQQPQIPALPRKLDPNDIYEYFDRYNRARKGRWDDIEAFRWIQQNIIPNFNATTALLVPLRKQYGVEMLPTVISILNDREICTEREAAQALGCSQKNGFNIFYAFCMAESSYPAEKMIEDARSVINILERVHGKDRATEIICDLVNMRLAGHNGKAPRVLTDLYTYKSNKSFADLLAPYLNTAVKRPAAAGDEVAVKHEDKRSRRYDDEKDTPSTAKRRGEVSRDDSYARYEDKRRRGEESNSPSVRRDNNSFAARFWQQQSKSSKDCLPDF